jgi:hypothetical protein
MANLQACRVHDFYPICAVLFLEGQNDLRFVADCNPQLRCAALTAKLRCCGSRSWMRPQPLDRPEAIYGVTISRTQSGKSTAFCLGKSTQIVVAPPAA